MGIFLGGRLMALTNKQKVAAISITSNTALIFFKTLAGLLSGSISIISEAIHSSVDLVAAIIAYFSVTISGKPPDEMHPYGHGKIENISGVIEGLLIFVAAVLIIKEAVEKILHPQPIEASALAIGVMLFSAAVNYGVSRLLYKTAKEEDSIALEADALHLRTDVYTSAGVAVGLLLLSITGIQWLDPVVALLVALLIVKEAWNLCRVAFNPLLDVRLEKEEERPILEVLDKYKESEAVEIGYLRTRKSGAQRFIDFHLYLAPQMSIEKGTMIAESIKIDLAVVSPEAHIHINIEPLEKYYFQQK